MQAKKMYQAAVLTYQRRDVEIVQVWDPTRRCLGLCVDVLFGDCLVVDGEENALRAAQGDWVYPKRGLENVQPKQVGTVRPRKQKRSS
jgi:hypothetical protein